jgi:hypothetical protein
VVVVVVSDIIIIIIIVIRLILVVIITTCDMNVTSERVGLTMIEITRHTDLLYIHPLSITEW